ncbi:DUF309 domain-containing protein [Ferroplasma acidiphilum]|uniref:DUF309 domain-containing protein n=2 Tax=Ferroplasma acidiphilum TaxID=74969 RepID=A0A1V0N4Z1_9ARCH|nr:DUF309 domain-containing protein [Ferroplasma acidiphilum]ARD85165.1 putative metal-dependent hydrolase [Ferroplasma acidiphilum]NOL59905.1 DUF309 domain-containing protein [Ferroplasma acidiphilum]
MKALIISSEGIGNMQEYWNPGRYINIYNMRMDRLKRDSLFMKLKENDPFVYDLRVENGMVELSYFLNINKYTTNAMGKYFFTSDINYLQEIRSFDFAVYLMEGERYWEAHEVLENNWKNSSGIEKLTYQYIILLCAAGVHMQRGHDSVCRNIILRANKMKILNTMGKLDISGMRNEKSKNPYAELSDLVFHYSLQNP